MSLASKISVADILCEFFEVILHNILYTRKLYPETIFAPKRKYGVVVYQSIQPDVNEYINQCLKAIGFHARNKRLKRLIVCFHNHNETIFEKYIFEVLNLINCLDSDPFLVDLEQSLRDFVLKLHSSQNYLEDLPDDATFSVRLETSAYSCLEFNQQPAFEDFPWIELREETENCIHSPDIVPVHTLKTSFLTVQMYIERETLQKNKMDNAGRGIKRKSRLAVFEHVGERRKSPRKKKFQTNRLEVEDSSPSESELVIEDEREPVKNKKIRLTEEQLNLHCEWNLCHENFDSWQKLNTHIVEHASLDSENMTCQWANCGIICLSNPLLVQHVSYHGYLSKLKNIGQNMLDRNDWPDCNLLENCKIPVSPEGYTCYWEYCSFNFLTIYDFYSHMEIHVHNNPRVSNKALNEIIKCCWQNCNNTFSTKYKLAEHIRTHTKEKIIACPTCCTTLSNRTKLSDHRKRQLATDLQSYQCSQCLKLFPSERLLREHMRSHINHYKCTMCDMTCPKPSLLAKHIRFKHIKDRPYKCHLCLKTFVDKHNLNTHLRTHDKKSLWKCNVCSSEFELKSALDSHCTTEHQKCVKLYQCHCCKRKFLKGAYLTRHLMKRHNYHWPSGHSRFQYRKDQDGLHRLQTVRYESLEVTQEMLRSESMQSNSMPQFLNCNLSYGSDGKPNYVLSAIEVVEPCVTVTDQENSNILITIDDVDEYGNVIRSEVVESGDIVNTVFKSEIVIDEQCVQKFTASDNEMEKEVECVKRERSSRTKKKAGKNKTKSVPVVKAEEEDVRHFSKDVILNYNKFEIRTPRSESV